MKDSASLKEWTSTASDKPIIEQYQLRKILIKEFGDNLANGIPPWFFNFWWRFINLQDEKTAILRLPTVLQHTAYKIAVPLTISTGLLNLFIHAMRTKEVITLFHQHHFRQATKMIGTLMMNEAKNPETIFNALYSLNTCLGWTLGNAGFVWMASTLDTSQLVYMAIGTSGAVTGYLTGAFAIGIAWGSLSYVYQRYNNQNIMENISLSSRSWSYIKNSLKELPGLAACASMSGVNLSAKMASIPGVAFRHIIDSCIVATASSVTNSLQMGLEKICRLNQSRFDNLHEKKPLLEKDIEKGEVKHYYQSIFTMFQAQKSTTTPEVVIPHKKKLSSRALCAGSPAN